MISTVIKLLIVKQDEDGPTGMLAFDTIARIAKLGILSANLVDML